MNDAADKAWLRTPADDDYDRGAPNWLGIGLVGVAIAIGFAVMHTWGVLVGTNDEHVRQQAERRTLLDHCRGELGPDARALVDVTTGHVICASGSNRLAPLSHPMTRIQ